MKKPNFFIIGAPKCGTTSLAAWLAEHPQIFMSPKKEPFYFNDDTFHRRTITSLAEYETLFADANERHLAVGEASTGYLFSHTAVPNILDYAPDAKFVVSLRNPVTMAPSLHEQRVYEGAEPITDFWEAWQAQFPRRAPESVPKGFFDPQVYEYGTYCKLGEQLERLYSLVPRERVLVLFTDDMKKDSGAAYRAVLAHVGVPDDGRSAFPTLNSSKERKWLWVRQAALQLRSIKHSLGIKRNIGILAGVEKWNKRERPRSKLPEEVVTALRDYFADDIARLSAVTGRDLSGWLR